MPGSTCARTVIAEGPVSLSGCFELEFRSTRTKSKQFLLPRDGRRRMITASFTENYQNKKRKTNYVGSWTIVQLDVLAEPETASSVDALEGCRPFTRREDSVAWDSDLGIHIDSKPSALVVWFFPVAEVLPRKETVMAGRLLSPLVRLFSLPEPGRVPVVIQMSQRRGSARIPVCAHLPSRSEMDLASRASAAGLGCIRGTTFAFLFEAGAALVIYAVCQLSRLFR
jgi:hypothetical protein